MRQELFPYLVMEVVLALVLVFMVVMFIKDR